MSREGIDWRLGSVLLLYGLLSLGYSLRVPLWEAPDEPAHFIYVQQVAEQGVAPLPQQHPEWKRPWLRYATEEYEGFQPPLYYEIASRVLRAARHFGVGERFDGFPPIHREGGRLFRPVPFAFSEVHLLRLLSVAIGGITLLLIYALVRTALPGDKNAALLATGWVAFNPQYTFLSSYVGNDGLSIALSAAFLLLLLRGVKRLPSSSQTYWILTGALIGLALATKLTSMFLLPVAVLAGIMVVRHGISSWRASLRTQAAMGAGLLVVLCASFLLWPHLLQRVTNSPALVRYDESWLEHFKGLLPRLHISFFAGFGWLLVLPPSVIHWTWDVLSVVGCFGAVAAWRSWRPKDPWVVVAFVILCGFAALVFLQFIVGNLKSNFPQGRYLFPALPALACFIGVGWSHILAKTKRRALVWCPLALMLATNAYCLVFVIGEGFAVHP